MADTSQQPEHFLDYWRIIQSRKEVVITVALFVIVVSVAVTLSLPKVYVASTRILVKRDTPDVPLNQQQQMGMNNYDPYFLRTQFEIIQSTPILHEVIRNLRLNELFGRVYNDKGTPLDLQQTSKILTRNMKVQQYRDTNLIEIRIFRSSHQTTRQAACEEAARIANEIAAVYRDQRMKVIRDEKRRGLDALNDAFLKQLKKAEELEKKLEESRKDLDLTVFMAGNQGGGGMASLDKAMIQQLEGDRITARSHMVDRKTRLDEFNKLTGEELLYSAAYIVKDPALSGLRQQSIEAQVKLRELVEIYGPKHPEVIRAQGVVKDLDQKIQETLIGLKSGLQTEYEISRVTYEALEKDLAEARKSDIQSHSARYLPFTKLQADLERQRQIRDALELRLVQEKIEFDLPRTPVEVIDMAEVPNENDPVRPRLFLNLLLGIIAGLGTGIGLAFFIEYIDTSVKTVEDIEKFINSTILGIIPQKVRSLLVEGAESRHAEAYRVLRTNIQFSKKMTDGHSLCLTSGGAGEGKSLTSCNLAFIYAYAGQKTLLVDADLRRPTQHKMFKISNAVGFADYLMGKKTAKDLIIRTSVPQLDFIPSGKLPSAAHGVMTVDKLRDFIAQLRPDYEMIIFDAPPIMGVSDASILASEVDGVLLVVQHRSYPRAVSGRAKTMIDNVGGNLVGVVLNNINLNRDYYYYYHSSYYYGNDGSRRTRDAEPVAERKA
jgi:succinoglycan biosynthesis transport protein ExoP